MLRRRAQTELLAFSLYTKKDFEVAWHNQYLCQALDRFVDGDITRLIVMEPPRHGKSELVSRRLPALIHGRFPRKQIMAASYAQSLASLMNRDVQRIIDSDPYKEIFPDTRIAGEDETKKPGGPIRNTEMYEVLNGSEIAGSYRCSGIGGAFTGMGADYLLIDDPIKNLKDAYSQAIRDTQWDWYTSTARTRLNEGGRILITLTRWHDDDLVGRLLKLAEEDPQADQWTVICLPAIREPIPPLKGQLQYDPRKQGEALWPRRWPTETLQKLKSGGSGIWQSLFQQSPIPAKGNMVKRDWFKFYTVAPSKFDEVIMFWDMSFKEGNENSYVVGQCWGRVGADKYLLDQVREQMDFNDTVIAVQTFCAKHQRARWKGVEDKANGPAVISTLKKKIAGLIAVSPDGSKEARFAAVTPDFAAGNVHIPDPSIATWVHDYIAELTAFPKGAFDDQVDATSGALLKLSLAEKPDLTKLSLVSLTQTSSWR